MTQNPASNHGNPPPRVDMGPGQLHQMASHYLHKLQLLAAGGDEDAKLAISELRREFFKAA